MGRSRVSRVLATLVLAMVAAVFPLGPGAGPVAASASHEGDFLALVNQERAARGLGRLVSAGDLVTVARRHSARMSAADEVFHNSNLSSEVDGWELLGENVGVGPTVPEVHKALMGSTVHRDVILHPRFTQLGVGVLVEGGEIWLTQVFRLPDEQAAPVTTTAPAPPATAPQATAPLGPAPPATATPAVAAAPGTTTTTPNRRPPSGRVRVAGRRSSSPAAAKAPSPTSSTIVTTDTTQETGPPVSLPVGPVIIESAGPEAIAVSLPEPEDIPTAGLVAAGLLLAVVGSASVATRRPASTH